MRIPSLTSSPVLVLSRQNLLRAGFAVPDRWEDPVRARRFGELADGADSPALAMPDAGTPTRVADSDGGEESTSDSRASPNRRPCRGDLDEMMRDTRAELRREEGNSPNLRS